MTVKIEVFADTLMSATVCDGVIRLEFGTFEGSAREGGDQGRRDSRDAAPSHRLLMPLPGFVRSLRIMQELLTRLEQEKGRRAAEAGGTGSDGAGADGRGPVSGRVSFD